MIHLTTGKPGEGMTYSVCAPSAISNGLGSAVVASSGSGQGGCIPRNAHQWRAVADFLDVQWLASLGLRRVGRAAGGQAAGATAARLREAHPVGNTGITSEVGK